MTYRVTLPVDEAPFKIEAERFKDWYRSAKPKDWYTYHYGTSLHENLKIKYVKEQAWDFACEGKVYLFQQRDPADNNYFFFKAQKASRKIPSLIPSREVKRGIYD